MFAFSSIIVCIMKPRLENHSLRRPSLFCRGTSNRSYSLAEARPYYGEIFAKNVYQKPQETE